MRRKRNAQRMIYPIIIYPFSQPREANHLQAVYETVNRTCETHEDRFCRPVTVLNRQTYRKNEKNKDFQNFFRDVVEPCSEVTHAWSVDTCQMWLAGFGYAYDQSREGGRRADDVFWLIPGDFYYDTAAGRQVLGHLVDLPNEVYENDYQLCLGEIKVDPNNSKQLIDTYGTYALLYNWFPNEAQVIRRITDKPRSEFFAIGSHYLDLALQSRWYAYEQTIVILLHGTKGGKEAANLKICKKDLGVIDDDPQGRNSLAHAMQQVERTERVLKLHWREDHSRDRNWQDEFKKLDAQSEQIRGAAMVILEQVLKQEQ